MRFPVFFRGLYYFMTFKQRSGCFGIFISESMDFPVEFFLSFSN